MRRGREVSAIRFHLDRQVHSLGKVSARSLLWILQAMRFPTLVRSLPLLLVSLLSTRAAADERPPNLVLILADDLGFSDLGCYGGEIETPNLDRLAARGLRGSQFYNTTRCWPTRAVLMTGYYAQQVRRDELPGLKRGKRPRWARLLPEMLRARGYSSYHSGKWHIDGQPIQGGFDRSYWLKDQGRFFSPRISYVDDQRLPPVERGSGFYGTTSIAEHAARMLREHDKAHRERPFFLYLAFTAPHFPLHALPDDIAKYRDRYRKGWDAIREARWKRIRELGIVASPLSHVERDLGPPYAFPKAIERLGPGELDRPLPWSDLDEAQRTFQAEKMAIHAAMVDRMDREIGRVLAQLRAMDALENTLIVFLSDNGASAEIMVRDDGHDPQAPPGSAATYLCLGPGWSTVANTPFRRHKTWVHEGGTSTPLIVHWPARIRAGTWWRRPGHAIDLLPTFLDAAGARRLTERGVRKLPEPPGESLLSAWVGGGDQKPREFWWAHEGHRAYRAENWKVVAAKGEAWELYNLATDRCETRDLAHEHPDRVHDLASRWQRRADAIRALHGE